MVKEILKLRHEGKSYNEIVELLGCSKSTVSYHCIKANINDIGLAKRVPIEIRCCEHCNAEFTVKRDSPKQRFCSKKCSDVSISKKVLGSINGLKSVKAQNGFRRSKNEILLFNLCKNKFKIVLHNVSMFNGWDADIIIEDFKLAILWNGKWHYEKITNKHSVSQVQNRDKIKIKEIKKAGYIPYVIKDMGRYNPDFVKNEFDKLTRHIPSLS
jgi:hypothetical protein